MAANRGSTTSLLAIAEVTPGVTPATPAMLELPLVSFSPRGAWGVIRSNAIRNNPFPDKILNGSKSQDIGVEWEMGREHDLLLETFMGAPFTTDSLKFTDALKTLTVESRAGGGSSLFDHFLGFHLTTLGISVSASDTAPVQCTASGRAFSSTLDDAATIAGSVVAAGVTDPFTFIDANLTLNSILTPIVSGSINLERVVNPLNEIGFDEPSEYVPDSATVTGTMTVAYRDNVQSGIFEDFLNVPQVYKFGGAGGAVSRTLTIPQTKFVSFGRAINGRGVRLQEINWEAQYDAASGTIATFTRDNTP